MDAIVAALAGMTLTSCGAILWILVKLKKAEIMISMLIDFLGPEKIRKHIKLNNKGKTND